MDFEVQGTSVVGKLARMRKPQRFRVWPTSDGKIMVQSERSIGMFDYRTGAGRLSVDGSYFHHLAVAPSYQYPVEFVRACLQACPALDGVTEVGGGAVVISNTVEVVGTSQAAPQVEALFPLGDIYATPGAAEWLGSQGIEARQLLARHCRGDWGNVDAEDRAENELSLQEGFRILSVYGPTEAPIWVITEADRSSTTILLPHEY